MTFPLTSYVEQVGDPSNPETVVVRAFRPHFRRAEHAHRVVGRWTGRPRLHPQQPVGGVTRPGLIVTLVYTSPARRSWGFVTNRDGRICWLPWRRYVAEGGKAVCQPVEPAQELA